jgi:hypothetical protein
MISIEERSERWRVLDMSLKKGLIYLVIASFLVITACQMSSGSSNIEIREKMIDPVDSSDGGSNTPNTSNTSGATEASNNERSQINTVTEKIVTLGIEGYEQDIEFTNYQNDWVDLWYDTSLDIREEEHKVLFYKEEHDMTFSVTYMDSNISQQEKYEEIEGQMTASGYDLINDFSLVEKTGEGYIFYSAENRDSIDVYFLRDEKDYSILVQFAIPENMMEDYISRFEYMVQTIELIS